MTKSDHINYWRQLAAEDMDTAQYNLQGGKHVPALFFWHLTLEKLLKALWVKNNIPDTPPFTHDLQKLMAGTSLECDADCYDYLNVVNAWNLEARYPEYTRTLRRIADKTYMAQHEQRIKKFYEWLLSAL
jgi:HEPN domain-containing protein